MERPGIKPWALRLCFGNWFGFPGCRSQSLTVPWAKEWPRLWRYGEESLLGFLGGPVQAEQQVFVAQVQTAVGEHRPCPAGV